jgi:hypothetical protein
MNHASEKTRVVQKKIGKLIGTRLQPELLGRLDSWRKGQSDLPNRPEAVRRLIAKALAGGKK